MLQYGGNQEMAKISKDEYLSLKKQGFNDSEVARKVGLTRQAIHQMGKKFGLHSGPDVNKIKAIINMEYGGLLSYARRISSSEGIEAKLCALFIYQSLITQMVKHLLLILRHFGALGYHAYSSGKVTIIFNKKALASLCMARPELDAYEFPDKEKLLDTLDRFIRHVGRISETIGNTAQNNFLKSTAIP